MKEKMFVYVALLLYLLPVSQGGILGVVFHLYLYDFYYSLLYDAHSLFGAPTLLRESEIQCT